MCAKKSKHKGGFSFIHMKENTAGSSNEISFDVLEAKRNAAEEREGKRKAKKSSHMLGGSLFTLPKFSRRKVPSTPAREDGIILSGDVPEADGSTTPATVVVGDIAGQTGGIAAPAGTGGGSAAGADVSDKASGGRGLFSRRARKASGASGAAPELSFDDAVRQRKSRRRARNLVIVAVVAVAVVVSAVGVSSLIGENQRQQEYRGTLVDALDMLAATDDTVIALDDAVYASVDRQSQETIQKLVDSIPSVTNRLDQAQNKVQQAAQGLTDDADKEAISETTNSIKARKTMILAAKDLVTKDLAAKKACDNLQSAWDKVLAADLAAREAVKLAEAGDNDSVRQSEDKSREAIDSFQEALTLVNTAQSEYPSADLSLYASYIGKRIEEQGFAIASDEGMVLQDRATAESNNSSYNTANAEAAAMARRFPANTVQPVLDAYSSDTTTSRQSYADARAQVGTADAYIRDYLKH